MRVQITLKSGAQIEVDVAALDLFPSQSDDGTFAFGRAKWRHPEKWSARLVGVVPQEIAAVVQLKEQVEEVR